MSICSITALDACSYSHRFDQGRRPHLIRIAGCFYSASTHTGSRSYTAAQCPRMDSDRDCRNFCVSWAYRSSYPTTLGNQWLKRLMGSAWTWRGAKPKWQEADLQFVEQLIEQEPRTYNSAQLAQKLAEQTQVKLSPRRLRHLLQKRAIDGNAPATASEANKTWSKSN